jgi:hypothetical protein
MANQRENQPGQGQQGQGQKQQGQFDQGQNPGQGQKHNPNQGGGQGRQGGQGQPGGNQGQQGGMGQREDWDRSVNPGAGEANPGRRMEDEDRDDRGAGRNPGSSGVK